MNATRKPNATIMVVDDDDDIRFLIARFLREAGYLVIEAETSGEAEHNALKQHPDLILMDLSMPGTDGFSAIWTFRRLKKMANVPIIIISAHDAFDLRAEAAAAGCIAYLTKPLEMEQLMNLINSTLEDES